MLYCVFLSHETTKATLTSWIKQAMHPWFAVYLTEYLGVDFQMQLAHAQDDGFFTLCVKMHSERRIFPRETVDTFGEFVQVILSTYRMIKGKSWRCNLHSTVKYLKEIAGQLNYFYLVGWFHWHGNDRFWDVNRFL